MKIVALTHGDGPTWGVVEGDGIIDLGRRPEAGMESFAAALRAGSLMDIAMEAAGLSADRPLEGARLLPPVPEPRRILFAAVPRRSRPADEREAKGALSFVRRTGPVLGDDQPILHPRPSAELCVAGALAVVIGGEANSVPAGRALEYAAGYSCLAELSLRGLSGKGFRVPVPWGPYAVTPDDMGELGDRVITTRLNGVKVREYRLAEMAFSVAEVIAEASIRYPLAAGDLVVVSSCEKEGREATGMRHGDRFEVEIDRIGLLRGRVAS